MYQSKIKIMDKEITIQAGKDKIYRIISHVKSPLNVTAKTSSKTGCTMQLMFGGSMWSWEEFSPELKAQYDAELVKYAESLPAIITARTELPGISWAEKYVPDEIELKAMRENRKSPEEKEQERIEMERRKAEAEKHIREQEEQKAAIERSRTELIVKYPFLTPAESRWSVNAASANIKKLLSTLWPSVKWSVTSEKFSMGDSITVKWTNGPSEKQVKEHCDNFKEGHFNGMEDIYENVDNAWHVFGSTKYMHYSHKFSPEKESAIVPAINAAIEECDKSPEDTSSLHTIAGTEYTVGNRNGNYSLWSDSFICNFSNAERAAAFILENDTLAPVDLKAPKAPETAPKAPASSESTEHTCTPIVRHNEAKNGIEVQFPAKPEQTVIEWLKAHGFRWSKYTKLWYTRWSETLFNETKSAIA